MSKRTKEMKEWSGPDHHRLFIPEDDKRRLPLFQPMTAYMIGEEKRKEGRKG